LGVTFGDGAMVDLMAGSLVLRGSAEAEPAAGDGRAGVALGIATAAELPAIESGGGGAALPAATKATAPPPVEAAMTRATSLCFIKAAR
jgi:hypothetical protein